MRFLPAAFLCALGLALASMRGARADDAKPQVTINEKEHTATIHFGDPGAATDRFSGVQLGLQVDEVTYTPGAMPRFSVKLSGYIGNGFPEDVFVRKIEPGKVLVTLSALTPDAPTFTGQGEFGGQLWPEPKDWLLLRGRTFTRWRKAIRDDACKTFRFTKNPTISGSSETAAEAVRTVKPGVTTVDITATATISFCRMGSPKVEEVEVTIPLHAAVSGPAEEK